MKSYFVNILVISNQRYCILCYQQTAIRFYHVIYSMYFKMCYEKLRKNSTFRCKRWQQSIWC